MSKNTLSRYDKTTPPSITEEPRSWGYSATNSLGNSRTFLTIPFDDNYIFLSGEPGKIENVQLEGLAHITKPASADKIIYECAQDYQRS